MAENTLQGDGNSPAMPTGGNNNQEGNNGSPPSNGSRVYTQDELNAIIPKRAQQMAKKMAEEMLEERLQGAIKSAFEEHGLDIDNLPDPQRLEKAHQAQLTRERNRAAELEKKLSEVAAREKSRAKENAIVNLASGKVADLVVFKSFASNLFDIDEGGNLVVVDEKGAPLPDKPEEFINHVLTKHPVLAAATGQSGAGSRVSEVGPPTDYSKLKFDSPAAKKIRTDALKKAFGGG